MLGCLSDHSASHGLIKLADSQSVSHSKMLQQMKCGLVQGKLRVSKGVSGCSAPVQI